MLLPEKIQQGQVYASVSYVRDFLTQGILPKIHSNMGDAMTQIPRHERTSAIDVGACHGMLTMRAHTMGWANVLGLEYDQGSINLFNTALKRQGVSLQQADLNPLLLGFAPMMTMLIQQRSVTTVFARRVLSELFSTVHGRLDGADPKVIADSGARFTDVLLAAGVKYLVMEGRSFSSRSTHPIPHTQAELDALGPRWQVIYRNKAPYGACLLMPR